jgi:hypothetical protein
VAATTTTAAPGQALPGSSILEAAAAILRLARSATIIGLSTLLSGDTPQQTYFYHGTDVQSGLSLLNGAPLNVSLATGNKIDGPVGFYLATDPVAAEYFALRRDPGTVLQYRLSSYAIGALTTAGSQLQPIPAGGVRLPGSEFFIPPSAFPLFNSLRTSGNITVSPYQ